MSSKSSRSTRKSSTLKKNSTKKIDSTITRVDKLPFELRNNIYNEVYKQSIPKLEEKVKVILDNHYIVGLNLFYYDVKEIRKKLKIKHYTKDKEIKDKLSKFRNEYIFPLISDYFDIRDILDTFEKDSRTYDGEFSNINKATNKLISIIKLFNNKSYILKKKFNTYILSNNISEENKLLNKLNKISNNKIPLLLNKFTKNGSRFIKSFSLKKKSNYSSRYSRKIGKSI